MDDKYLIEKKEQQKFDDISTMIIKLKTSKNPPCPRCGQDTVMGSVNFGTCLACGATWDNEEGYQGWRDGRQLK